MEISNIQEKPSNRAKHTGDTFEIPYSNDGSPAELDGDTYIEDNGIEWVSRTRNGDKNVKNKAEITTDSPVAREIAETALKTMKDRELSGVNHG